VSCPTLVLRGGESVVATPEGIADLQRGLPHCRVTEVAGGSHLLLLERPAEVAALIQEFLDARVREADATERP
jgi:3-oxoadipate enol-lactonase